jgi:DNA-binding NtrC family response regulator
VQQAVAGVRNPPNSFAGWVMGSEKRVLIVDDENTIADTLKIIFSNAGYSAQAAYSAEQALLLIAE